MEILRKLAYEKQIFKRVQNGGDLQISPDFQIYKSLKTNQNKEMRIFKGMQR